MGVDINIVIERKDKTGDELFYISSINEVVEYMETIGINIYDYKMITPQILEDIKNVIERATMELELDIEALNGKESILDVEHLNRYKVALYEITVAIHKVKTTRQIGEKIMYLSAV